jgi:hypothetical protein
MAALASSAFEPWRYADPACRDLKAALDATLAKASASNCDAYTRAHLADLKDRTDAALDAVVVME